MKITIEPTNDTTTLDGVPVRHWKGTTDTGIPVDLFVHRVAVREDRDCSQFEAELKECIPAARDRRVDLRFILP
jgi:hypothetical protein